jgi:hypothetical protein
VTANNNPLWLIELERDRLIRELWLTINNISKSLPDISEEDVDLMVLLTKHSHIQNLLEIK